MLLLLAAATLLGTCAQKPSASPAPTPAPYFASALATAAGDPCAAAAAGACGSTPAYCAQACAWNASAARCQSVDNYPTPSNASLADLVGPSTPLRDYLTISTYGDSITWLDIYQPILLSAITSSPHTAQLAIRLINQGVNGGTIKDLVRGFSPWGHLNPSYPQTNITFQQTLDSDRPNVVVVQIGINDVWQASPKCGDRCSNVTEFVRVLREEVAAPLRARNMSLVIASVSTIGEAPGGANPLDATLDAFAAAQRALAAELGVPFVALRAVDEAYEAANNCLALYSGVLTRDGVHPSPRGGLNLANLHAGGIAAALRAGGGGGGGGGSAPYPYGGRVWLSAASVGVTGGGVAAMDAACTAEAPGGVAAKALVVDEGGCAGGQPCRRASITPWKGDGQVDWPLLPRRTYYTADNASAVGFTTGEGLFAFPNFRGVSQVCVNQVSGMNGDFTTAVNATCNSWRDAAGEYSVGWSCSTNNGLFNGGRYGCSLEGKDRVVCVTLS